MNGIMHKQAQRYIRADLDGLLTDAQRLELKTHLDSCPVCRADSESFTSLRARLQTEFHARWDAQDGPSKHVMTNIHSQTRRIIMSNRIKTGIRMLAGIAALILLGLLLNPVIKQLQEYSHKNSAVPGSNLSGNGNNNIGDTPTPATLTFSLTVQEAEALAGFDVLVPSYLPEGYTFQGAAYNPQYQIVTLQYISLPEDSMRRSTISISQKLGEFPDLSKEQELGLPSHATPVPVENVMGKFTHGVWVYDSPDATTPRWEGDNDYYSLSWQKDGMSFAVDFLGGVTTPPIQLNELTAIAKSLKSVETLPIATDKSNGEWIAFIGTKTNSSSNPTDQLSTDDVYLIHPDGTGLTNLTNNAEPAGNHLEGLQWSPNGKYLAFVQIRGDTEILGANQEGSYAITNVHFNSGTMAPFDVYSWSPDGIRIAFVDNRSGNYDIYTVFADGRNDPQLAQLTNDPAQEVGFVWSPDGSQIAYEKLDGNNLSIYIMNADGSNQREVAHGTGKVRLQWSKYGAVLYAMANTNADLLACDTCVAKPAIYRIGLDGQGVSQVHYEQDATGWYLYDTPHNTLYFMRAIHSSFLGMTGDWMYLNDNSVHDIGEFDPHQTCKTTTGNILNEYISPNERFSIISDFCAGGFDLYLADREAATPEKKLTHLLRLPLSTLGEGGDSAYLPIRWSPDGRWLIYASGSVYLLNVEKAIQESDTKPSILVQPQIFVETSGLPTVTPVNLLVSSSSATWQP